MYPISRAIPLYFVNNCQNISISKNKKNPRIYLQNPCSCHTIFSILQYIQNLHFHTTLVLSVFSSISATCSHSNYFRDSDFENEPVATTTTITITAAAAAATTTKMGSLSRLSRDTRNLSRDHKIYVAFYSKNSATNPSTFIDCYTPYTNSWHRATSIPGIPDNLVLKDFALVPLDHYIFVVGGRLCPKASDHDSAGGEDQETIVPCVRRYDVSTNTWETCKPMSTPRFNFACTVSDNKIYVAGGQSTSGLAEGIPSTEVYDPALDQWRSLANMKTMRYKCVGVTWNGRIYVVGGFCRGGPYEYLGRCSAEVYDVEKDKWIFLARMWDLDVPPNQIVAVNERLFSSGDCLMPWKGHIEAYDEIESIWNVVHGSHFVSLSQASTAEATMGRLYVTMAPIGNQLYFLAGYKIPGQVPQLRSEVHVFDTAANGEGWRSFEPVEEDGEKELCGHCCVMRQES